MHIGPEIQGETRLLFVVGMSREELLVLRTALSAASVLPTLSLAFRNEAAAMLAACNAALTGQGS